MVFTHIQRSAARRILSTLLTQTPILNESRDYGAMLKRKFGASVGPAGIYLIHIYLNLYGEIGALVITTILHVLAAIREQYPL